ncbi:MAG: hypothetical protein WBC91_21310 [Phototrophicaceae bacterium]
MRKIGISLIVGIALLMIGSFALVSAQDNSGSTSETSDAPAERDSVAVTIYNQGTALVQDRRTYTFTTGDNLINFTDVAALIDPTSVSFTSITDPLGTRVLEQNYIYDLVGTSALLRRYVDETIRVTTADSTVYEGQLLSGSGEIILRTAEGGVVVISQDDVQDIQFPELPSGLITRPTLRWLIDSQNSGDQQVELTYLTNGINWTADYNILLGTDNNQLDLNGWVTLNNTSGTAFQDATVKLVAGDVNRIQPEAIRREVELESMAYAADGFDDSVAQREFFEYQLYEIARNVTVGNNETKQVEFVNGTGVTANTFYVYDASPQFYGYGGFYFDQFYGQTGITDVANYLEFSTDSENGGLGADLPAGRIRVYQQDTDGSALLIGENRIDHTPEGEDVQIYLGNAFDLVGQRTQTDFNQIGSNTVEETFEIRLRNRKDDETVQIRVPERLTRGANWEIISSSIDYTQTDAFGIEFRADVAPDEEVIITYTVRYTNR